MKTVIHPRSPPLFFAEGSSEYRPATSANGIEYLRLTFKPTKITLNGMAVLLRSDTNEQGYVLKNLGNNDYAVTIKRMSSGNIIIAGF